MPSSRIKALTLKHIEALGVPVKTFVLNRTPPPSATTPSNINIITATTCVKSSDSNNNSTSNVLEINTSLQIPNTLSPNGNGIHVNSHVYNNGFSVANHNMNGNTVSHLSPNGNNNVNTSSQSSGGLLSPRERVNDVTGVNELSSSATNDPGCPMTPNTPTSNSINPLGFVHTSSAPIPIPNTPNIGGSAVLSSLLTPATSPSCSPVSSLSSYHSL